MPILIARSSAASGREQISQQCLGSRQNVAGHGVGRFVLLISQQRFDNAQMLGVFFHLLKIGPRLSPLMPHVAQCAEQHLVATYFVGQSLAAAACGNKLVDLRIVETRFSRPL